jgi:cyclase
MEARLRRTGAPPRRTRIASCGLTASLALLGPAAQAAGPDPGPPFTLRQVAPGVYAAIDQDARAGANAGFVIGDDGVVVVDSFQFPEAAESLLAGIRKLTPLPVRFVINTHYHIDHVAGDGVFQRAGALVVAQRNVLGWIRTENLKFYGRDQSKERALVAGLPLPDLLVDQGLTIRLGGRRLELRALPGHTGGDLVVAVPDAKVLFSGDLLWRRMAPGLSDATVSGWIETLEALRHRPDAAAYTYVPGQGDVATLADIGEFERYLEDLTGMVRTALGSGAKGDELVAAALAPLKAKYGTWGLFQEGAPREIPLIAAELSGTKRLPPAQPGPVW